MAHLHLTRDTSAPPTVVWDVVTDFAAYAEWMPLTRMRLGEGAPRLGWAFAGRSGVGPVGFTDSMVVSLWEPPGSRTDGGARFRVVKTGRVLGGWVDVTVEPRGAGSRLDWREDVVVRPLPLKRAFAPAVSQVAAVLYGRALDAMVSRAEAVSA
jgi:carbon monoxide dehydrogenase subunit G